jgi:hypothetical protein
MFLAHRVETKHIAAISAATVISTQHEHKEKRMGNVGGTRVKVAALVASVATLSAGVATISPVASAASTATPRLCPPGFTAKVVCWVIGNIVWDTVTSGGQRVPNRPICRINSLTITSLPRC